MYRNIEMKKKLYLYVPEKIKIASVQSFFYVQRWEHFSVNQAFVEHRLFTPPLMLWNTEELTVACIYYDVFGIVLYLYFSAAWNIFLITLVYWFLLFKSQFCCSILIGLP